MIANFPRPNKTVFLKILADTMVRGTPVQEGEVVEVTSECAGNILSAGRGRVATPEEIEETAPEPEGEPTQKSEGEAQEGDASAEDAAKTETRKRGARAAR